MAQVLEVHHVMVRQRMEYLINVQEDAGEGLCAKTCGKHVLTGGGGVSLLLYGSKL